MKDLGMNAKRLAYWIAIGFGAGRVPKMPGTAGTLVAVPLLYGVAALPEMWRYLIFVPLFLVAWWSIIASQAFFDRHDDPRIVIDEVVGFYACMMFLPIQLEIMLFCFVLFRFFDIVKPWPIRWVDRRCQSALGVILDDLLAAVFVILVFTGLFIMALKAIV